jgi:hypothetical protein
MNAGGTVLRQIDFWSSVAWKKILKVPGASGR